MKPINLLPAPRQRAVRFLNRARLDARLLTAWAGLMVIAALAARAVPTGADPAQARRLEAARTRLAAERAELVTLRDELATRQRRLAVARAVADHPDWSRLLALLGRARGDDAVLDSIELTLVEPPTPVAARPPAASGPPARPTPTPRTPERYLVRLAGLARSTAAATRFALTLEQTGVFARVQLAETRPAGLAETPATAFRVEAELAERPISPEETR